MGLFLLCFATYSILTVGSTSSKLEKCLFSSKESVKESKVILTVEPSSCFLRFPSNIGLLSELTVRHCLQCNLETVFCSKRLVSQVVLLKVIPLFITRWDNVVLVWKVFQLLWSGPHNTLNEKEKVFPFTIHFLFGLVLPKRSGEAWIWVLEFSIINFVITTEVEASSPFVNF